jgi:ankyrin repeat protein
MCICRRGYLQIVNLLLNNGANIEADDDKGARPLHVAASASHFEIVKSLIAKGADMKALTSVGRSALSLARRGNFNNVVEFLRSLGAVDDVILGNNENLIQRSYGGSRSYKGSRSFKGNRSFKDSRSYKGSRRHRRGGDEGSRRHIGSTFSVCCGYRLLSLHC